jgi:hypothetical protein
MDTTTKRGRPRKYATAQDKATADIQHKREKRQKVAARERGLPYSNFYNLHLASMTPSVDHGYPIQHLDSTESSLVAELDKNQDIGNFLPPPSPPLQPSTEEVSFDDGESLGAAFILSSSDISKVDSTGCSQFLLTINT